jgi:hypothetical protein
MERRRQRIAKARVLGIAREIVMAKAAGHEPDAEELIDRVGRRELAPRACARALLARWVNEGRDLKNV